ncbi:hypothetical protein FV228_14920 [Methylobacterium sp. WL18]|nr:hypothetical protein FV228_14920 [Methylobacterium sp. WL18]
MKIRDAFAPQVLGLRAIQASLADAVTSPPRSCAGPLSRAGEGQGEGAGLSGEGACLTPTLSRTGERACCAS